MPTAGASGIKRSAEAIMPAVVGRMRRIQETTRNSKNIGWLSLGATETLRLKRIGYWRISGNINRREDNKLKKGRIAV